MRSGGDCERHHSKLGFVCVKSDCIDKGLICNLCAREQHSSHGIMPVSTFVDAYLESSQLANSVGELVKQWRGMKNNGIEIAQQFENLSKNLSAQIASAQDAILANLENDMAWIENIVSREQSDFEQLEMELQLKGQQNDSQQSGISQEAVLKLLKRVKDVNMSTNSLQITTLSQTYSKIVNLLVKKNARIKTNILSETPKFASDFKSYFEQVNSALQAYDVKSNLQQVNLQSLLFPKQQGYNQTTQQPSSKQFQPVQSQFQPAVQQLVRGQEDRLQSFGVQPYFLNEQNSQGNSKASTSRNASSPLPVFASTTDKQPPELSPSQSFQDLRRNTSRNQNQNQSLNMSQRQIKEAQEITTSPQYQQQIQQDMSLFLPSERGQVFSRSKSPVKLQSEQKQMEQGHLQRYSSVQTSTAPAAAAALTTQSSRVRGINTTPKKIFGSTTTIIPPLRISTSQPKDSYNGIQQQEYYPALQLQPITSQIMTESAIKKQNELIINTSSPLQSNFSNNNSERKILNESKSSQGQNSSIVNSSFKPMFGNDSNVFSNKKSPQQQQVSDFNQDVQYFKFNNNNDKNDAACTNPQYNSAAKQWNTNEQTAASQNSIPSLSSPNTKSSGIPGNQLRQNNNKKESFVGGSTQKKNNSLSHQSSLSVSFQENEKISLIGHQNGVKCLETLGTDRILSGGGDSLVKLWDRVELKLISQLEGHRKGVHTIKAEQTHRIIASGDGEGTILIWRYAPQIKKTQILKGHSNSVTGIVFENERRIISCSADGYVIIWDLEKGSCVLKLEQQKSVLTCLEIHGNMLLGACDKFVLFYELAGYKLLKKVEAHDGQINQISLVVRGTGNQPYIMTCSVDGCLFVWDGADTYEELDMIQAEEGNNKWNIVCFEHCRVVDLLIYAANSKIDQTAKIHSYNLNSKTSVLIADINCRINGLKVIGNELYVAMENNMIQMVLVHKHAGG